MNGNVYGSTELHLPMFKCNIPNDKVFTNVMILLNIYIEYKFCIKHKILL